MRVRFFLGVGLLWVLFFCGDCSQDGNNSNSNPPADTSVALNEVEFWLTKPDQTALLEKQSAVLRFGSATNTNPNIEIDSTQTYQTIDGFGYTLTGGSAQLINAMPASEKTNLLHELFGSATNSIGISYLRISIGASDLNAAAFSYDDMPSPQTDLTLANFKLDADKEGGTGLIPLLKEILAINPELKIIASPWSAPAWMKDNNSFIGGSLLTQYYDVYARYFVMYIQQMQALGIRIDAITPQNEPLNPGNEPSLVMTAEQQRDFIKNNLGPAFQSAGITTKIVAYDHNCDRPDYVETILKDTAAAKFVNGSAFHLYAGDISALSSIHNAYPDKSVYFTEQWTSGSGTFNGDLQWHVRHVIIGSLRNWSRTAFEWNLANDPSFNPHTPGGCKECKGAITISGSSVTRNVGYYVVGQVSKFVPPGSLRIASNNSGNLYSAAFRRPDGKKVLIVLNDGNAALSFNIKFKDKWITPAITAGAVATFIW